MPWWTQLTERVLFKTRWWQYSSWQCCWRISVSLIFMEFYGHDIIFLSSKWSLGYLTLHAANEFTISLITLHGVHWKFTLLNQPILLCSVHWIWKENFHFSFWSLKVSRFFLCSIMLVITVAFELISVYGFVYQSRRGGPTRWARRDCHQTPLPLLSLVRGPYCA